MRGKLPSGVRAAQGIISETPAVRGVTQAWQAPPGMTIGGHMHPGAPQQSTGTGYPPPAMLPTASGNMPYGASASAAPMMHQPPMHSDAAAHAYFTEGYTPPTQDPQTDLYYSSVPREHIHDMANALGVPLINITTKTIRPERSLLHSCLNIIQAYVRIDNPDEVRRGERIANNAHHIVGMVQGRFFDAQQQGKLPDMPVEERLDVKKWNAARFISDLVRFQQGKPWDAEAFDEKFPLTEGLERYQHNAIHTFRTVNERIANEEYTPPYEHNAETITRLAMDRDIEYRHYRKIGCELAKQYVYDHPEFFTLLTRHPVEERKGVIICGGMGSGKSGLSAELCEEDMAHQNADFLKHALRTNPLGQVIHASEHVQQESSIAAHESKLTRCHDVRTEKEAPHAFINAIRANREEINEFINGGRHIEVHHLSACPDRAVDVCIERGRHIGRTPPEEEVRNSYQLSAQSLFGLENYAGHKVSVHLHEREDGDPVKAAEIDCENKRIVINDRDMFNRIIGRAAPDTEQVHTAETFIRNFRQKGFDVTEPFVGKIGSSPAGRGERW